LAAGAVRRDRPGLGLSGCWRSGPHGLAVGTTAFEAIAPVVFLLLAALHAVPLVLDARTSLSPLTRGASVALVVGIIVAAGVAG
jgi:hypothetical protein